MTGKQVSKDEARDLFKGNQFKLELIDEIQDDNVGIFYQGDFYDLCKGGHVVSTEKLTHFKLMGISGAYWRADRKGIALQRISGVAFETKEELDAHLQLLEDLKKYDHRRLGKDLDLFSFSDVAPGAAFFHPKGTIIHNKLIEFLRSLQEGIYDEIKTPMIMHESLWKQSGHYAFYKNNMFFTQLDETTYCVRPMNCPGGALVYKTRPRSYRELPIRLAEFGYDHRCELSGVLHGLFRVRAFTMDDAHIFCTLDQLEDEVLGAIEIADMLYKKFKFSNIRIGLSTRPEKSMGTDQDWEVSTQALKNALDRRDLEYTIQEGEGAFYGPKIEFLLTDTMGREWQCGTVQIDFNLPINFDIEYIDSDQSRKRPAVIHRALYGSLERFIGIILEHYKGHLPFWIAPIQIRVLTITDEQHEYAQNLVKTLASHGLRVELDTSGEKVNAQIRNAQLEKIPWMLIVGKKEQANNTVTLRHSDGKQEFDLTLDQLLAQADRQVHE
ncbi:MAG: threonine--tRNA ligase [bacterium]